MKPQQTVMLDLASEITDMILLALKRGTNSISREHILPLVEELYDCTTLNKKRRQILSVLIFKVIEVELGDVDVMIKEPICRAAFELKLAGGLLLVIEGVCSLKRRESAMMEG